MSTSSSDTHTLRLRVVVARREAESITSYEFAHPDGAELPAWEPGAHVDVHLPSGTVRQYSLCGDPAGDRWRIAVLREPDGRGGSAWVHDSLHPGAEVRVRGPRNHFALVPAPRYLFVAGGIGITPILPMIVAAEAAGAGWELAYGGRSRSSMAFRDELTDPRVQLHPQDEAGLLDLDGLLADLPPDALVYCCGPEPLLAAVEERCPPGRLHTERFAPKDRAGPGAGFEVELARSGLTVSVPPDRSILDVAEEAGVGVLSSCSEGTCGTCETPVLHGEIDHRDSVLTAEEQAVGDCMMICVSRARCPRLVLDL
ncbi:MAG: PDR/VanB family oxidoreductase [Pseudonocardia sp.]